MLAQGDLGNGVSLAAADQHDLDGDLDIDHADIGLWLQQSAAFNGYGSAFLRGDSDGVSSIWPTDRDVDQDDLDLLTGQFDPIGDGDPTNGPFWEQGNFNGDDEVDITDFNSVAVNFAPSGYGSLALATTIPEPTGLILALAGVLGLMAGARRFVHA